MVKRMLLIGMLMGFLSACQQEADPILTAEQEDASDNAGDVGSLPGDTPAPGDNQPTASKVNLGRMLFWDPILSGPESVSCATCHHPDFGYSDGRDLPIGTGGRGLGPQRRDLSNGEFGIVGRNSPTVINTAFNGFTADGPISPERAPMFWDNRTLSLENQALGPPTSFSEMRGHAFSEAEAIPSVVARLQGVPEYVNLFETAFPGRGITDRTMAEAIASFERTIVARNSPFDRFQAGDINAMNQQQQRGLTAFIDARCNLCHSGPMFSDFEPHALGVPEHEDLPAPDAGVNGTFAFRTPTLRNMGVTAPYFHNGTSRDLRDVMQHYVRAQRAARDQNGGGGNNGGNGGPGGGGNNNGINPNVTQLDPLLGQMQLQNNQIDDIIAFIGALDDNSFDRTIPSRVPSGLPVGGDIK